MKVWSLEGCPVCGRFEGCSFLAGGDCSDMPYDPREEEAAEEEHEAARETKEEIAFELTGEIEF